MTEEEVKDSILESQKQLIKELARELTRIKRNNLRLKTHMQVLVGTPRCKTAEKIRYAALLNADLTVNAINLN
jgi:hypothetical protein